MTYELTEAERLAVVRLNLRLLGVHPEWIRFCDEKLRWNAAKYECWYASWTDWPKHSSLPYPYAKEYEVPPTQRQWEEEQ